MSIPIVSETKRYSKDIIKQIVAEVPQEFKVDEKNQYKKLIYLVRMAMDVENGVVTVLKIGTTCVRKYSFNGEKKQRTLEDRMNELVKSYNCSQIQIMAICDSKSIWHEDIEKYILKQLKPYRHNEVFIGKRRTELLENNKKVYDYFNKVIGEIKGRFDNNIIWASRDYNTRMEEIPCEFIDYTNEEFSEDDSDGDISDLFNEEDDDDSDKDAYVDTIEMKRHRDEQEDNCDEDFDMKKRK